MIDGVKFFTQTAFEDERGELWTTWDKSWCDIDFVRDKVSTSKFWTLRGIHGDFKSHKLVSCIYGRLFFVLVDNRKDSPTYLQHQTLYLRSPGSVKDSILIPPGVGNGFVVLSESAVFNYKWSYPGEYPDVDEQFSLRWNDPKLNIRWPIFSTDIASYPFIMSDRDKNAPLL